MRLHILIGLIIIPAIAAAPYTISEPGFGRYYDGHVAHYRQTPWNLYSGVYNKQRFGHEVGHNPYYMRNERGGVNQMEIRSQHDLQYHNNPELFRPRTSVGPVRYQHELR